MTIRRRLWMTLWGAAMLWCLPHLALRFLAEAFIWLLSKFSTACMLPALWVMGVANNRIFPDTEDAE